MILLTDDTFYETLSDHDLILVDFWATWCGPCRQIAPVLEAIDAETVPVAKVDVDQNPNLLQAFKISSVPTLILFKEGVPVARVTGVMNKQALLDRLENWL